MLVISRADVTVLRLTTVHEDRVILSPFAVILSEAKNLALLRIGPRSNDQSEILRGVYPERANCGDSSLRSE
jgi:hypothetical protein